MKNDGTIYETVAQAMSVLCLDMGFDPFLAGEVKGRPTIATLGQLGYRVDRCAAREQGAEAERRRKAGLCPDCGDKIAPVWTGAEYRTPSHCPSHETHNLDCPHGHHWREKGHWARVGAACPVCGEPSV